MLRFAVILLLVCLLFRWAFGKWPWQALDAPTPRARALREARALLSVGPRATRDEILLAHRRVVAAVHPDRGGSSEQVHAANEARDLLCAQLPPGEPGRRGARGRGSAARRDDDVSGD